MLRTEHAGEPDEVRALERLRRDEADLDRRLAEARADAERAVASGRGEAERIREEAGRALSAELASREERLARELAEAAARSQGALAAHLAALRERAARGRAEALAVVLEVVEGRRP